MEGSTYPVWEEVVLTEKEEKEVESKANEENLEIMKQCIDEAKDIMKEKGLNPSYHGTLINLATSLFEKKASHVVFHKESKAKEKFDKTTSHP